MAQYPLEHLVHERAVGHVESLSTAADLVLEGFYVSLRSALFVGLRGHFEPPLGTHQHSRFSVRDLNRKPRPCPRRLRSPRERYALWGAIVFVTRQIGG